MKYVMLSLQFFFLLCGMIAKSETPESIPKSGEDFATKEVRESLQRYVETLAKIESMPPDEAIPMLDEMMVRTFRWQDDESMAVYKTAQQKLLSIPDHANYFTDKIEKSWKSHSERVRTFEAQPEWKAAAEKVEQAGEVSKGMFDFISGMWGDYAEICSKNLEMLGHIPSTESVRALGHYLQERDEPDFDISPPGTGALAAESLTELISDGPMQTWQASWEDVPKWQQWFDEVKVGKRTFRFVGSDVDYTLDGPADARNLKRIKERNSSTQRSNITKKHATPSGAPAGINQKGPVFHAGVIAAMILCLAALIYFFRRRHIA